MKITLKMMYEEKYAGFGSPDSYDVQKLIDLSMVIVINRFKEGLSLLAKSLKRRVAEKKLDYKERKQMVQLLLKNTR